MLKVKDVEQLTLAIKPNAYGHRIKIDQFSNFTYAARWHWKVFEEYDLELFDTKLNPDIVDLKCEYTIGTKIFKYYSNIMNLF